MKRSKKQCSRKNHSRNNSLDFGKLEDRKMFAVAGYTSTAVLDFDGEWMNDSQLDEGGWDIRQFDGNGTSVSFPSFNSLFNTSRPWLDLNGNGVVSSADAQLAIDQIVDKVMQDFSPYDLDIVVGDQDSYRNIMGDFLGGDVTVIISGGADNTLDSEGVRNSSWGWSPVDHDNSEDVHALVYAGGSVDSFNSNADQWLNQVARTISHEMGHSFGLEHQVADIIRTDTDSITHSIMGVNNRDWTSDFSFHDRTYMVDDAMAIQNAHRHLLKENILGASRESWMAVLKPGELTIQSVEGWTNDVISVEQATASQWRVTHNDTTTLVDVSSLSTDSMNPFDQSLSRINVYGEDGHNRISIESNMTAQLYAWTGAGSDVIYGGRGNDYMSSGAGNDRLYAYSGNDTMYAGSGNDRLYGYSGNDRMFGGSGDDLLSGSQGNDLLRGGSGYDRLYGSSGNDILDGGLDGIADYLNGGTGADRYRSEMYVEPWNRSTINREIAFGFSSSQGDRWY